MGKNTAIEWADHTFNPWIGCQKVSAACDFCYAETLMDTRLGRVEWGPHGERRRTTSAYWRQPYRWDREAGKAGRKARVFCASLADVFDNRAPAGAREDLWQVIRETPNLIWMLLTKRPENVHRMLPILTTAFNSDRIWLGATVESQNQIHRSEVLRSLPVAVRFLSMEPLLGPVNISPYLDGPRRFQWIIAGGESGANARPMHPEWVRGIREQCLQAGVPFFFKQWGTWVAEAQNPSALTSRTAASALYLWPDGTTRRAARGARAGAATMQRVGKTAAGRLLDGRTWDDMPGDRT